ARARLGARFAAVAQVEHEERIARDNSAEAGRRPAACGDGGLDGLAERLDVAHGSDIWIGSRLAVNRNNALQRPVAGQIADYSASAAAAASPMAETRPGSAQRKDSGVTAPPTAMVVVVLSITTTAPSFTCGAREMAGWAKKVSAAS